MQKEKNTNFVSKIWWTVFRSKGNCKRSVWANVTALYFCHAFVALKIIRNCLQGKGPVSKISLGPLSSVRHCLYPRHPESSICWGRQHIMEWALIQWDPTFLELINWDGSGSWTWVSWCLCCACCSVGLLCSLPSLHLLFLLFCLLLEHSLAVKKKKKSSVLNLKAVSWHRQEPRDELWQEHLQGLLLMRFLCCWRLEPRQAHPFLTEQPTSCWRCWLWAYQQPNLLCVHRANFLPLLSLNVLFLSCSSKSGCNGKIM